MPVITQIEDLRRLAQKRVKEQFGIELELEIEFLGDFNLTNATSSVLKIDTPDMPV